MTTATPVQGSPVVAISSCRVRTEYDGRREVIDGSNAAYTRAVLAAGGAPVLLPYGVDVTVADTVLAGAHALLLTGGDDIVGACPAHGADRGAYEDPVRDLTDRALLSAARRRRIPVLGVCRGMQMLVVCSHGSLARVHGHAPAPGGAEHHHEVVLESSDPVAAAVGVDTAKVTSLHSFAVADPGLLRVAARARDGVIEAVIGTDPDRLELGVQWHPELDLGPLGAPVVRMLVAAAARFAEGSASGRVALVGSR